ncbi:MAG: YdcH family protein [Magnetovibrionaceae bacterium]
MDNHHNDDTTQLSLRERLAQLTSEHRDLDDVIQRLEEQTPFDQLQVKRLKKRKLLLKDQIIRLESQLLPDIIA